MAHTLTWLNRDASVGGVCPHCNEIIRDQREALAVEVAPAPDIHGHMMAEVYECPVCFEIAWFHCPDSLVEMVQEEIAEQAEGEQS